ncbi:MAG TPA: sulfatase-like hydrolase/transferase, partial [Parafilimonas sp.]|nr:sulfatase-like hydrolase/transferase [Parafilimonas sp.]
MRNTRLALALIAIMIAMHTKAQHQKPNIILILVDDVGYKSLTCNGGNLYSTPNIDKLAKQGMRFTQCYSSPACSPSRHIILTGKYNFRNYIDWGKMNINEKTIGNMMKKAGYKTGFFGKDQLGSGDKGLKSWGFDAYCIHDPAEILVAKNRYKNPHIYTHGDFLPDSLTLNRYGPDIVSDSLLGFISKNKAEPFFVFYPMILVHKPICPTPDDTAFANWDARNKKSDTSFYSSMMHYTDKKIGELITKLKNVGIDNNTVIIFTGDNGTATKVADHAEDDSIIMGGKQLTAEAGTHVPLIVYWPGTVKAGAVNHDLIDFTDILPTLAGIAKVPTPTNYGTLDGISFFPRLTGKHGTPRNWIFNDYVKQPYIHIHKRWAQTKFYKLYDTSSENPRRLFYNIRTDVNEEHPIANDSLTAEEAVIKQQLLDVITSYVAQGIPIISAPSLSSLTGFSVTLKDTIYQNGGSTVTASGAVWSTKPDPEIPSSSHTSTETLQGPFSTEITGLTPNTTYYIRAYAVNFAGTVYSNQVKFTTLDVPVATKATEINSNKFTANWNAYSGASTYRLDISESPTFTKVGTRIMAEGFDSGIVAPEGWTISSNIKAATSVFGVSSPAIKFTASKQRITTALLSGPAIQLKFWIKGMGTDDTSSLLVEGFDGNDW